MLDGGSRKRGAVGVGGVRLIWSAASSWQHSTYSNLAREAKFINNPGEKCLQR